MATRTPKGTWKAKADGDSLESTSFSANAGDALIVFVGNQTQNVPTSVTWGTGSPHSGRDLIKTAHVVNTTSGLTGSIWIARKLVNTATRTINVKWPTSIGARAMAAVTLDNGHIRDQFTTTPQQATAAPSVGPTSALSTIDGYGFGLLVMEGPSSDIAPSVSASPTDWLVGQTDGTVGPPPISNITIYEFYKQLDSANALTLSTSAGASPEVPRDWANILVGYRVIRDTVPIDVNGSEILVGDTVKYNIDGATSTVSSFTSPSGHPYVKVTLANGLVYNAHTLEVI